MCNEKGFLVIAICRRLGSSVILVALSLIFGVSGIAGTFSQVPESTIFNELLFGVVPVKLSFQDKISDEVLRATANGDSASTVIVMAEQANVDHAYEIKDHDERGWFVYRTLTEHAKQNQAPIKAELDRRGVVYKSFWAANIIVAELDRQTVVELASRSDVAKIDSNKAFTSVPEPSISKTSASPESPAAIEWGVANVNAPALWSLGYNGSGIVVGGLDTGIRWTHSAIKGKYRGWNGSTADHNYNWLDSVDTGGGVCGPNTLQPCDDNNHGSHTVGTMVGDDGAGNQIGVAPGAKWIGCRNMNTGNGTPASYTECFQFMIAPTDLNGNNPNPSLRPHIVNNSWGCPASEGCVNRSELELIVNNTQAAGIFVQASAGNSGGAGCSSVSEALAIYDASFAAGAIDVNNALAGFSSRGPSTFYNPSILKPNLSAPGVSVRSIGRASDTTFNFSSGTSMASPHVAGVIALLWSARPNLVRNIAATKALLQNTANPSVTVASQTCGGIPSTQIPNNSFGYGRIDALAAYNASATMTSVSGRVVSPEGAAIRNASVRLIDALGVARTATTSSFGIFTFDQVRGGESYTLTASTKRYRFAAQQISVGNTAFSAADLVGLQ